MLFARKAGCMLRCYGTDCPLRADCYRYTNPAPGRDAFGRPPYDAANNTCAYWITNVPTEAQIRDAAYFIWLREGRPAGQAAMHWAAAERAWQLSLGRAAQAEPER